MMHLRNGKRCRSRSPSVTIPRLSKVVKKNGSSKSKSKSNPPDSVTIFYKTVGFGEVKSYTVTIPFEKLKLFAEVDCSSTNPNPNQHIDQHVKSSSSSSSSDNRNPTLDTNHLCTIRLPEGLPFGNTAIIDSTAYSMFKEGKLMSMNLDFKPKPPHYLPQQWKEVPTPPFFDYSVCKQSYLAGDKPTLVSLAGFLFFFGGHLKPFGQVYDPKTSSWSLLKEPPGIDLNKSSSCVFLTTSLGESRQKLLFFGLYDFKDESTDTIFILDLQSGIWTSRPSTYNISSCRPWNSAMIGSAVVKEEDHDCTFLYWINENAMVYALDWENLTISEGPVVGFDHEKLRSLLHMGIDSSFFHVWGDLFCLVWSQFDLDHLDCIQNTAHHFTFLRVIHNDNVDDDDDYDEDYEYRFPGFGSLTAYVVGCLQDTVDLSYECFEALLV